MPALHVLHAVVVLRVVGDVARALAVGRERGRGRLGRAEPAPSQLNTDSQSARDVSYNPEHHDRMKHVQRRHFFVRDMVENLKIEVPLVRTADNWSDFFTKTFDAKKFHAMRREIMNER